MYSETMCCYKQVGIRNSLCSCGKQKRLQTVQRRLVSNSDFSLLCGFRLFMAFFFVNALVTHNQYSFRGYITIENRGQLADRLQKDTVLPKTATNMTTSETITLVIQDFSKMFLYLGTLKVRNARNIYAPETNISYNIQH